MKRSRSQLIWCDRCPAKITTTTDDPKSELEAADWLPCPRKGGRLVGMCPKCRPRGLPVSSGRSTPCSPHLWVLDRAHPYPTEPPRFDAICNRCGGTDVRMSGSDDVLDDYALTVAAVGRKGPCAPTS
jgi:Zn finger protein HypA/HybF involved in hydrogenase expression